MPVCSSVFPGLSCTSFKLSGLILRSLIHFELILTQGKRHGSNFSFLHADTHFSQQHLLKRLSFLHHMFWVSVKNKVDIAAWIHIWVLYSVPLVFMSAFVPVPCWFYCYGSIV
jgi:hypothetical protein